MTDLVAIAAVWRDRARVADQAAADMKLLVERSFSVLMSNQFGEGCVEGIEVFEKLKSKLNAWSGFAAGAESSLSELASGCREAAESYEQVDKFPGE